MGLHRNARLGLAGRRALVADVESGCSCREAARRRGVSPTTACKWWRRWSETPPEQRGWLACLEDRSSRPHRSPRLLSAVEQQRICAARRRSGWGPRLIAGETGHPHATVWRALRRGGISRPPRQPREQPCRYEWPCPGDLLHIDTKRFVRFSRPGHAVTGDRHVTGAEKRMRVGYEWVHSLVDDHSRLAYSELHRDERALTVTGFVARARLLCRTRHRAETAALRQRLRLPQKPFPKRTARAKLDPTPLHPTPPATDKREGRTLPTNLEARMGTRRDLPHKRSPSRSAVTLAPLLQHAQTAQLTRRPITHQPRPQRPEA
jgi:transposase